MNKKRIIILVLFLVLIIVFWFLVNFSDKKICPIEYSEMVCINNSPVIGFYNPNSVGLVNISLMVPSGSGFDIYNVNESLKVNTTEVLIIFNSPCSIDQKKIKVSWCCDECYSEYLRNTTNQIEVST